MIANRMLTHLAALTLALPCAVGCASTNSPPPSYAEERHDELESERAEFIEETREDLAELDTEIAHLSVKIKHESKFVDEEQRAEWRQDLFELKQERTKLTAELERARTASHAEWQEMRGNVGSAVDGLQAGVAKVRAEVTTAFDTNAPMDEGERASYRGGLCAVDMPGVDVDVDDEGPTVVVTITTDDPAAEPALRQRAAKLAADGYYRPVTSEEDLPGVAVGHRLENVTGGVKLILTPANASHVDALEDQLDHDRKVLGTGRCTPTRG
jgi:hypothetical protein